MVVLLFDDSVRQNLLPFTHTRPVAEICCGILTMRERWEWFLSMQTGTLTEPFLQPSFNDGDGIGEVLLINAAFFANKSLTELIEKLPLNSKLTSANRVVAARLSEIPTFTNLSASLAALSEIDAPADLRRLEKVWDIFSQNGTSILEDFASLTRGLKSQPIPEFVQVVNRESIFLEEGAVVQPGTILNAKDGPIYIGRNAEIMEGCLVRGPFAMREKAVLKMGAKVYADTTLGSGCKVGGEVSNVVFFANSNKGHDGYLGNSVIGEWCNLGADTNASNLKNNYDGVKIWDEATNRSVETGLTFCGLLMGDHSKCGINTMFNTGTVVGVCCNLYGAGFPEKFIPSFSWGGSDGLVTYKIDRAMETANRMMARRGLTLQPEALEMYNNIFEVTAASRALFHPFTKK